MKVLFDRGDPPRSIQIAADRPVHDGPCLLVAVAVVGAAQGSTVVFYDGLNANGEAKLTLTVPTTFSLIAPLPDGILFDRGLYVAGASAVGLVTVSWYRGSIDRSEAEEESE